MAIAGERSETRLTSARVAFSDVSRAPHRPTTYKTTAEKAQESAPRPMRARPLSNQRALLGRVPQVLQHVGGLIKLGAEDVAVAHNKPPAVDPSVHP